MRKVTVAFLVLFVFNFILKTDFLLFLFIYDYNNNYQKKFGIWTLLCSTLFSVGLYINLNQENNHNMYK
jgi:hypothetical protein